MQKKLWLVSLVVSWVVSCILMMALVSDRMKDSERTDRLTTEASCQRIEYYTKNYFRFLEDIKIDTADGEMVVSVSFVPEVGSFPVKEEIYQNIAYHALQTVAFFPEVSQFYYK